MPVSHSFRTFVLDQLAQIVPQVRAQSMFGGVGIYAGERFFALIAADTLYVKVGDASRTELAALGSRPFQPFADKPMTMDYYDVPLPVLESVPRLRPLVEQAVAAAAAKQAKKRAGPARTARGKARKKARR